MHPLDGAYERVNRANKHLADLKRRVSLLRESKRNSILSEYRSTLVQLPKYKKRYGIGTVTIHSGIPKPIIGILVGEVIYNLRAALDYLVYELAQLDSKQVVKDTQFPIEDSGKVFVEKRMWDGRRRGKRKPYLCGLNDIHIALISRYQPCYGCDWMELLREISNPDKHRTITVTESPVKISSKGYANALALKLPIRMQYDVSIDVFFTRGKTMPVVETIEQLCSQVSDTIRIFHSEFD